MCSSDLAANVEHLLVGRPHRDNPATLKFQPVAVGQARRVVQVEEKRLARVVDQSNPAAIPVVEVQRDGGDGIRRGPCAGRGDIDGATQAQNRK